MIDSNSPRWSQMEGGYRMPYDPRPAIQRLEADSNAWDELWNELHHQGDVGEASYAAVPLLVELAKRRDLGWQLFALLATIETERHRKGNPKLPDWLATDYAEAWNVVLALALSALRDSRDAQVIQSAMSVVALAKNQLQLGALLGFLDESEIDELVNERLAWKDLYGQAAG